MNQRAAFFSGIVLALLAELSIGTLAQDSRRNHLKSSRLTIILPNVGAAVTRAAGLGAFRRQIIATDRMKSKFPLVGDNSKRRYP